MGSFNPRGFDPLDLEIIDQVYDVAWAQVLAREPYRDTSKDGNRKDALRKHLFALASSGKVNFDTLCDGILASFPNYQMPDSPTRRYFSSGRRNRFRARS
jgi:hypothetical protein